MIDNNIEFTAQEQDIVEKWTGKVWSDISPIQQVYYGLTARNYCQEHKAEPIEALTDSQKRLQAVRDGYWDNSAEDEFDRIHDAVVEALDLDYGIDHAQVRKVYNVLPNRTIGLGIRWGFSDTEVGDEVYTFVKNNASIIRQLLF